MLNIDMAQLTVLMTMSEVRGRNWCWYFGMLLSCSR